MAPLNTNPEQPILDALRSIERAFSRMPSDHMVIGGIAVIAHGLPRHTDDIDATLWAEGLDLERLMESLASNGIDPRIDDALEFARRNQVLLMRHTLTGTPMEVSLAWLPFEREALDRAESVDFGGVRIRVATPEDLVIFKAVAWRDRDRADIERLLVRHGDRMDLGRIRSIVEQFATVLEDPGRMVLLDEMISKGTSR